MKSRRPKLFVTPGTLRYNRFGTGGNGGNFGTPPALASFQQILFSERWGEYASGDPHAVAAANWTFTAATNSTITNGTNQISYPSNGTAFQAATAALAFNAGSSWELDFEFAVNGGTTTNSFAIFAEDDSSSNVGFGVVVQCDNIDGNLNAQLKAAGANVGADTVIQPGTGLGDHKYRLTCDGGTKRLTLYMDGTQVLRATPAGHSPTGSKKITIEYTPSAAGNVGFIGPLKFKAFRS